ncbi:hypothetical protein AAC387_Pa07g3872 [Persea americana]
MAVDVGKFLLEKLHEFLVLLQNLWTCLLKKFDEVFPHETRAEKIKHWLQIGWPVGLGLAAVLLLLCVCCFCPGWLRSCCGSWLGCCRRCFCCCCGRRGKMMKAPGRDYLMPRDDFESDPGSYFIDLRSNRN